MERKKVRPKNKKERKKRHFVFSFACCDTMLGTVSLSSVLCAAAAAALLYAVFLVIRHFFLLDLTLQGDAAVPCIKGSLPFIGLVRWSW